MKTLPEDWIKSRLAFEAGCSTRIRYTVLGDVIMYLDADDESLTPDLIRDGHWEAWVSIAIARVVTPDSRCLDVGAHVGYFSALMALRGAIVTAVEPQPRLASLIRSTAAANGLRISVHELALSDRDSKATLSLYGKKTGDASLVHRPGMPSTGQLKVRTVRLDDLTWNYERLDVVKIDCEGAEPAVWAGMVATRKRFPGAKIVMEVDKDRGYDLPAFLAQIQADGYPLRIVNYDGDVATSTVDEIMANKDWSTLWLARV